MMKVEGQKVERRRRKNRDAVGAEDRGAEEGRVWGGGVPLPNGGRVWGGAQPLPRNFFNFLSRNAAFWVQSDAFSDIRRPVPNSLYTHSPQRAQISLSLPVPHWVRDAGYFKGFFTGGEKRLKGQDVRVTGGIAFGFQTKGKDRLDE